MKFGVFDHVDKSGRPLAEQFAQRVEYVAAADRLGFYAYHVAEHHATPLNMVPVPGVFLGAVAQATTNIRLGPLTYLLPLYSPLRLIEEVGMFDHLSNGRMELGVGRGVSPFELNYHNYDPETARAVYGEALEVLIEGMTHDKLSYEGKHFNYTDVPMELRPLQEPHPPLWYPSSNPDGSRYAGENGFHYCTLGGVEMAKANIAAYREAYAKRGSTAGAQRPFPGGAAIGISRQVTVAETDEAALKIAGPAYKVWHASLTKLWRENNVEGPSFARNTVDTVEKAIAGGVHIAGSPETVREQLAEQIDALGVNYMVMAFNIGDMAHEDAMRSIALFGEEVMPKLADL
ncbi:MAG: alkanesulfonate monooxygenase SsuD [Paracoccaceae bacterium]|jgi:alkanesulfonate monooxygenase SsuD/methylene tetrahydromethanopterin reductase-like flavin-dependent oxidoreductase (luciferase family)